jgi:pimeloyl-ACP methyl ester carboxylesterase
VDRGPTVLPGAPDVAGCLAVPGQSTPRRLSRYACGAGPGLEFARAGFVGVTVDGPQTGSRLVPGSPTFGKLVGECNIAAWTGEDWAMFNVCNPRAIADNIRESAFETSLVPDLLLRGPLLVEDRDPCRLRGARLDPKHLALMGHSMGATIAPLALALEPRFRAVVLSGANGSYIENVVAKELPKPALATTLEDQLNLRSCTTEFDLLPNLFQWAEEQSDPAVYEPLVFGPAAKAPPDVLMIQGIGDHYVPSPIANVSSLSLNVDLVGPSYDGADLRKCVTTIPGADVPLYTCEDGTRRYPLSPVGALLSLIGRKQIPSPPSGGVTRNRLHATGAVVQYRRDRVCRDDGHEVAYDIAQARWQYRCFLESFARGSARVLSPPPENPNDDALEIDAPCPF